MASWLCIHCQCLPRFLKRHLFFASPWSSWFGGYETSVECHQLFKEIVQVLNYLLDIGILHLHELIGIPDNSTLNYMMLLLLVIMKEIHYSIQLYKNSK